jgi:hypothetical protein
MPMSVKNNKIILCSLLAWGFFVIPKTYASSKSLAEMQQQIISMEACGMSITHELCNLDILDDSTRATIESLHQSKQKLKELQAARPLPGGNLRGSFGSNCYAASITKPTPFMGNNGEVFKLSDGSVWEVLFEYEYLYEYYPTITACPDNNFIVLDDKKLSAKPISGGSGSGMSGSVIESNINGNWHGWQGGTIIQLTNGQIWEQVGLALSLSLGLGNDVLIYEKSGGYYMMVDGEDEAVMVKRLN